MLQIVCVNAGNYCGRGKEYVEILYDMVRRNISQNVEGKFVCFTDDKEPYTDGIEKRPLSGGLNGWWNKIYLFKEGLFPVGDRIIYFDLDTVIVGGLDDLLRYRGSFAILRDVYRPQGLQSSVMAWESGKVPDIFATWCDLGRPILEGGDQIWIEKYLAQQADIFQELYPGQFRSYKQECSYDIPRGTRVVFFHGHPRPHECGDGWIEYIWKIGGGTTMELEMLGNTSNEVMTANVHNALSLPYENLVDQYMIPHDDHLVIVGGGPSLTENIDEIRRRQEEGQVVWALNNTFKFLTEREIYPDAHILLDARLENIDFVPDKTKATLLYSYQCHPDLLAKAGVASERVVLWCPLIPGILECLEEYKRKAALVGVGSTVGMKALGLAQLFGFQHIHLYGYDSSYRGTENHAYPQNANKNERIIEVIVNDEKFNCAPWMARQVQEFRECIGNFIKKDIDFTVHGSGLLPYVAQLMQVQNV